VRFEMTKHKGLTRTITRKQARSYARLTPNGMGVTAIAAVNGRGSRKRARRAAATLAAARITRSVKRHGGKSAHTKRAKRLARAAGYRGNTTPREALVQARHHAHVAASRSRRTAKRTRAAAKANPKRPPRGWFKKCVSGVKRTGGAIDPRAVCGATWSRKTVTQKRTALAAYEANAKRSKPMRRRKKPSKAEYARRYKRTQAILQRPPKPRASRRRIHGIPPLFVGGGFPVIVPPAPRRRRRARPATETGMAKRKGRKKARTPAQKAAFKRMIAGLKAYKKKHPTGGRRRKKGHGVRKAAKRRTRRYTDNRRRTKRAGRVFGGFHSVSATVGGRKIPTYLYRTKRGKLKKIPVYAIAGAKSKAQVRSIMSKGGKRAEAYRRRMAAIHRQRTRAGRRVSEHGDIFTPNRGIVVPYETWSASMTPNRRRKRGSRKSARRPKIHRGTHRSRSAAAKKAARTRAKKHEIRSRAAKKAARTRRSRGRHRKNPRHAAAMVPNRRRRRAKRRYTDNRRRRRSHVQFSDNRRRRRSRKRYDDNRKHVRHYGKNRKRRHHANRRRRTSYLPVRVQRITYASNRRRHKRYAPNRRRRHYSENPFSGRDFVARLKGALKVGALVAVGFAAHRAVTKILSDQVLGQVGVFQTGTLATYRGLISGLIVGSIAMYTTDKIFKKAAGEVNSGIFASLVHSVLTTVLNAAGQPTIAAALSAYPDAEGKAYHGFGEYVPVAGFGAYEMVSGLGASPMLSQAAAGFGDIPTRARYGKSSSIAQAAAGFGAPMLSQAAAGVGEYIAQGIEGIGDYEMVAGLGSPGSIGAMDDGIRPDLHSAERALNIAEAAAGVNGFGDIGTASTLNPMMIAQPISDAPEGMRAGILQGGDGIFG
jgi:hypothetical protein